MRKHPVFLSIALFILYGCIERYYPDEDELSTGTLVVVAHLNSIPGLQSVFISSSSTLKYPHYEPVSGCYVELISSGGAGRELEEYRPGEYSSYLDDKFLVSGESYSLIFITPDGERYESEYEKLHPAPEIDSFYYIRENHPTADPDHTEQGVQFYVDFEIDKESGRYLRWQLIETYEINNPEHENQIFDVDRVLKPLPDSSSWRTCWITLEIPDIYTMDLLQVEGNRYRQKPLNYVSSETRRLHYRYGLLVRQLALSREAFWYWNELGNNLQSKGSLFDTQPALTPSNICNVNDDQDLVIGYFSISGASEKRIFVEKLPDLDFYVSPTFCDPQAYPQFLFFFPDQYLPVYLSTAYVDGHTKTGEVNKECVDCREYKGSSNILPDFW
jgi:hypothetical protein